MNGADRSVAQLIDAGDWRPSYWTIACVGTFHLLFAATLLTATSPPLARPEMNVVDVVTFPDGVAAPTPPTQDTPPQDTPPVELKQQRPSDQLPVPKVELNPRLGPRPTDKRTVTVPPTKVEPPPPTLKPQVPPTPPLSQALPLPAPTPAPTPVPVPVPVRASPPQPPTSVAIPLPAPLQIPAAEPVPIRPAPSSPALVQPNATPLSIAGSKLKLKQAAALKPLNAMELKAPPSPLPPVAVATPTPALARPAIPVPTPAKLAPSLQVSPTPAPAPAPTQPMPPARRPSPPPPAFAAPNTAPLKLSKALAPLPKVQVPRINKADLRLPEIQAPSEAASIPSATASTPPQGQTPAGVTSVASAAPRPSGGQSGAATTPTAGSSGGVNSGSPPAGGNPSGGGQAAASASAGGPSGAPSAGTTGITGALPRRPRGPAVRQPFPTGDSNTVMGRMDKIYDCSRLNRERDARCPNWVPIEGRNSQGTAGFEVPVPKGLPKLRNPIGTNPLPVCPPGTPGSQMGLSCIPTREGPGIPRP